MPENPAGFGQPDADPDEIPTEPTSPPAAGAAGEPGQAGGSGAVGASASGRPAEPSKAEPPRAEAPSAEAGAAGPGEAREDRTEPDTGPPRTAGSTDTAGAPGRAGAGQRSPGERRSPAADEAAFLELIARFDQEPPTGERLWPAAEDVDEPRRPSVIIVRPAGRQPDGMPPDGRHLADPDAERTDPPTPPGTGAADAAPADLDGTGPDRAGSDPADTDRTGAGAGDAGTDHRRSTDRDEAAAADEADRARHGRGRDSRSRLDGIAGLDAAVRAAFGTAGRDTPDYPGADDDHYVPPPPPPVPKLRPVTRWALGSIALGVAILVVPTLIGLNQSRSQDVAGVLLILGGVGTLVARMGDRPPTDFDGPDDGAVV
ncbi:hypothetical protein [Parafrankia discariae]|uniref:hypothetical protein n=1 Tax=Parafrankia discariae TaxID=365528 RepID=UPI0003A23354|nr:hypothetical protein [Parafrankia discariae]